MERALRAKLGRGLFGSVDPKRSRQMSTVRANGNRSTELRLRYALVRAGISGWSLQGKHLPGNPDFVFRRRRVVVFVDGCFWHGCPDCGHVPKTNTQFWAEKVKRTRDRDTLKTLSLVQLGFTVVRFWEHELRDELSRCVADVTFHLGRARRKIGKPARLRP